MREAFAMTRLFPRNLRPNLEQSLQQSPAVFLTGARQVGKSTLAKQIVGPNSVYLTFDDPTLLLAAKRDPSGFLSGYSNASTVVFDEVQRVPELFLPLKLNIDSNRRDGRYLLTGSTSALFLPKLSDALVGRLRILNLYGLSIGELNQRKERFIDWCFSDDPLLHKLEFVMGPDQLASIISKGGFPEVVCRSNSFDANSWFDSYIQTILSRDVRDIVDVDRLLEFPNLLKLLAARSGNLQNTSELSRTTGIPLNSLRRYLAILEAVFLYQPLPPWHNNLNKRLVKSPKTFLADTGLVSHLLGIESTTKERNIFGHLLEGFILSELRKQLGWSNVHCEIFHWRTHEGEEVDFVLESRKGEIVGLEVKAAATVNSADLKGLTALKLETKKKFKRGVIFYQGATPIPFAEDLIALPISYLWL